MVVRIECTGHVRITEETATLVRLGLAARVSGHGGTLVSDPVDPIRAVAGARRVDPAADVVVTAVLMADQRAQQIAIGRSGLGDCELLDVDPLP